MRKYYSGVFLGGTGEERLLFIFILFVPVGGRRKLTVDGKKRLFIIIKVYLFLLPSINKDIHRNIGIYEDTYIEDIGIIELNYVLGKRNN